MHFNPDPAFDIESSNRVIIPEVNMKFRKEFTNIDFTGGTRNGGHGLSIGSVGGRTYNTVKSVTIESSMVKGSQNGLRIKTISGASGTLSDITYKNITPSGLTKYRVLIE